MFKLVVLVCSLALAAAQHGIYGPGLLGHGLYGGLIPGYAHGLASPYHGLASPYLGHGGLGAASLTVAGGSLAPGQPANVLGADGRPLDTLDVNVARAQHLTARIVDGSRLHLLKKRSVLSPLAISHTSRVDLPGRIVSPLAYGGHYGAPYGLAAPLGLGGHYGLAAPYGLGIGHLGLAGHAW